FQRPTVAVQRDGRDDDRADDDVLGGVRDVGVDAAVGQYGHDQAADQGAEHGPLAAAEAGAADHDGGDHLEFQPLGRGRVARATQEQELEDPGETERQAGQAV